MIVVEGSLKSGSLISAGLAAEQGREVFAVPGNINQPGSIGVNRLIADGAAPVISLEDLPQQLGLDGDRRRAEAVSRLGVEEQKLYTLIKEAPGCGPDYLQMVTGYEAPLISALLTAMELKALIKRSGPSCYVK